MAIDLTYGINPHQSVKGMVHDYNKREAALDAEACSGVIPKEEMEPNREGERMVARGRLNPDTGHEIPLSSKARKIASWIPSEQFMNNYDAMNWD